jgi:hypothetical protein
MSTVKSAALAADRGHGAYIRSAGVDDIDVDCHALKVVQMRDDEPAEAIQFEWRVDSGINIGQKFIPR